MHSQWATAPPLPRRQLLWRPHYYRHSRCWRQLPPRAAPAGQGGSPSQAAPPPPAAAEPQPPTELTGDVGAGAGEAERAPASLGKPYQARSPMAANAASSSSAQPKPSNATASASDNSSSSSSGGSSSGNFSSNVQGAPAALQRWAQGLQAQPQKPSTAVPGGFGTIWGLLVLSMAYLHHSTTGFALPSLLPIITDDLALTDSQGALLTAGYTVLYALALVPVGLLADRVDRPRLLSIGIVLWSLLTMLASQAHGFGQLLATRVGFAAAQATQNPICFSLIPELFPKNRTTAMAFYNSAIYAGRALSFAAVILAAQLGVPEGRIGDIGYTLVPLDKVDLSLVSILYTQGDMAAITPVYTYAIPGEDGAMPPDSPFSGWRQLLGWLGPPGLALAVLCMLTVDEPRTAGSGGFLGDPLKSSRFLNQAAPVSSRGGGQRTARQQRGARGGSPARSGSPARGGGSPGRSSTASSASGNSSSEPLRTSPFQQRQKVDTLLSSTAVGSAPASRPQPLPDPSQLVPSTTVSSSSSISDRAGSINDSLAKLRQLLGSPKFQAITFASAINDVGSWALVSWQATFYQRVYHLAPDVYAPLLAVVIPIGGIVGGVGAGALGDWLNRVGGRYWLTAVGNCVAAPTIALSLLAPDYRQSFAALLVGFALSEAWRAPAAIMVREVSPPGLGSTGSAVHLCIRNLLGGMGPIGVAYLAGRVGLQTAMLLVPACYLLSGLGFVAAEAILRREERQEQQGQQQ
ncbi:hypothetical protein N2152v2_007572 [Parachlorella kessleri]